ncbi:MAG: hypothetical protein HY326_04500, partial [Chloroflexi bacterium]|nr:hypothetical protein [Chloroflexota bacterium]
MKQSMKPILLLSIISPLLAEVLSGNVPPILLMNPLILLIFFFSYSLPVLVIREITVRQNLNLPSLFIFGLAYGIIGEGIWAKTLLFAEYNKLVTFNNYGIFLGVNLSLAPVMMVMHATLSVVYPILIVHYLFSDMSDIPWLSKKKTVGLASVSAFMGILFFFNGEYKGAFPYLVTFALSILLLGIVALRLRDGAM